MDTEVIMHSNQSRIIINVICRHLIYPHGTNTPKDFALIRERSQYQHLYHLYSHELIVRQLSGRLLTSLSHISWCCELGHSEAVPTELGCDSDSISDTGPSLSGLQP